MLTTMELFDDAALLSLIADATVLGSDLHAGLFTNQPVIGKKLVVADLTEPGYASYARKLVVMGAPFRDPQNGISSLAAGLNWQETGTVTPVTVRGIFYTYGAGNLLMGVEYFQSPISLTDLLDAFTTVLQYIQSQQTAGFSTVIQ